MPTLKAIHIYNSLQPTHKPKIAKEYVFANAENQAEWEKSQRTTLYKNNSGLIAKTKVKYINQTTVTN